MKEMALLNIFTTNICYQCLLTSPISMKVSILDEHLLKPSAAFASFDRLSSFIVLFRHPASTQNTPGF
jgi:hypothetical protein